MLTSDQIRAARGLLHWSARELAERAAVHITTVQRMERCNGAVHGTTRSVFKVEAALKAARVEFLSQNGGQGVHINVGRDGEAD